MSTDDADDTAESHDETQRRYRRGIRDRVLILPSVICSHVVADRIASAVDDCVSAPHDHGCAQLGDDNDLTRRTLVSLGTHPNVAGTVVVGLGCEHVQSDTLAADLERRDVNVRELSIQGVGGTDACVKHGVSIARDLRAETSVPASPSGLGNLTVGIVSTDVDRSTREYADPLVGAFADRVVDAGGRVLVAGSERVAGYPETATDHFKPIDEAETFEKALETAGQGPSRVPRLRAAVQNQSFNAVTQAWGDRPFEEVVQYGRTPRPQTDVAFVDASSRFEEAATALVAAGAHVVIHVTADGIPTGHPIAPVVKVSAKPETLAVLSQDIDINAREATVGDLVETINLVAKGEPTATERHGVTAFAIERIGPSM